MPTKTGDGIFKIIILFGVAMVAYTCLFELPQALDNRDWLASQATVTRSKVVTEDSGAPEGGQRSFARIEFTYEVAGTLHRGRWEPRKSLGMWGMPGSIVAGNPDGSVVTIYHAPHDPGVFVMHRGITARLIVQLVMGAIILALGGYKYGTGRKSERPTT